MSETGESLPTGTPLSGGTVDSESQAGAGVLLRQAREAAGLHIAALAVALKIPVKKLEALEADRFDLLPDAVFVRALASSVCRTLKVDAAPVLQRLPQLGSPRLIQRSAGINAPFRSPGDGPGPSIWAQMSRPAVLAGVLFMLAALGLILWPAMTSGFLNVRQNGALPGSGAGAAKTGLTVGAAVRDGASPLTSAGDLFPPDADAAKAGLAVLTTEGPGLSASLQSAALLPAPAFLLAAPMALAASAVTGFPASAETIVFKAQGESWVEVTDAKGVAVLRRTLAAGETAGASGALPLAVVIGRSGATQVHIRGKAFDLGAVSKDNVARFEVK